MSKKELQDEVTLEFRRIFSALMALTGEDLGRSPRMFEYLEGVAEEKIVIGSALLPLSCKRICEGLRQLAAAFAFFGLTIDAEEMKRDFPQFYKKLQEEA